MSYKLKINGFDVKTIEVYKSALDLLDGSDAAAIGSPLFREMLKDWECRNIMEAADSYETFGYLLINEDVVVMFDTVTGDVYDQESLADFVYHTTEYVADEIKADESWSKEAYVV